MGKPGRKPAAEMEALREKIKALYLNGVPYAQIAKACDLSIDSIYHHMSVIKKEWAAEKIDIPVVRGELMDKIRQISRDAAAGAARSRGGSAEVAFLRLQMEAVQTVAKMVGAYAPEKSELTGADGGPLMIAQEHNIDSLDSEKIAARLTQWAENLRNEEEIEKENLEFTENKVVLDQPTK